MAGAKLSGSTSRLFLLSVAALIMLSGAVVTEETRKCYWCGPLAEQIHRSQRAPSCDSPANQVTACDAGLSYCAVVATAPPYVESRYCVKNFREECYPLYCNSTRTWKMTCPCKGDLCNGLNTERETEAFVILSKLVAKSQNSRITKRSGQSSVKFIQSKADKTQIINESINKSDALNDSINYINDSNENSKRLVTEIIISNEPSEKIEPGKLESPIESTEDAITTDETENNAMSIDDMKVAETTETLKDIIEEVRAENLIPTNEPQIITNIQRPTEINSDSFPKPSEELPTAEALQQNASPVTVSEKTAPTTTVHIETTTTTILTTIENKVEKTTEQPKHQKNGDIINISNAFLLLFTMAHLIL